MHDDPGYRERVTGLSLNLEIDGSRHACFLDTGRTMTLAGTAAFMAPAGSLKRGFDIEYNGFGEFGLTRFHRRVAKVRAGGWESEISFRHHHADTTTPLPFVIGGGILKDADLHLSMEDRTATFYSPGSLAPV